MSSRSVATTHLPLQKMGPGFTVRRVDGRLIPGGMSQFVSIDWFDMSEPTFAPHPHAGFSAVTYLFDHSPGGFTNRWSPGRVSPSETQLIRPGSLHWTQAGSGMIHEEIPIERGTSAQGLQIFAKLPALHELDPPQAFHLDAGHFAEHRSDGVRVKVLVGEAFGQRSPIRPAHAVTILDVQLQPNVRLELPVPPEFEAFGLVVGGAVDAAREGTALSWAADGDVVALAAGADGATVIVAAGPPLNEAFVAEGPFMMSTPDRLRDAVTRFRDGDMGSLAPSF
jgi:redox-sensitive bicupin YhaK (pirin superfamily)